MTTITVKNFRAIKSAEIDVSGIALLGADNEGGKTSFIQACRSVLTSKTMPIDGIPKSKASLLVHSGTAGAEIVCSTDGGRSSITFPDMQKTSNGTPLEISDYASGAVSLVEISTKDRSKAISEMLKVLPSEEELKKELGGIDEIVMSKLQQTIKAQGWDTALSYAKETGAKYKALWGNETGEDYGVEKAKEWLPKEWTGDLIRETQKTLQDTLKQEQEWLEVAISHNAVTGAELEGLKKATAGMDVAKKKAVELEAETSRLTKERFEAQKKLEAMPKNEQSETFGCPYCGKALSIQGGKIIKPNSIPADELKKLWEQREQLSRLITSLAAEIDKVHAKWVQAKAEFQIALDADKKLKSWKPGSDGKNNTSVEDCRNRVTLAQARLSAYNRKAAADKYEKIINQNQRIIDVLAPDGLRLTVLKRKLAGFNKVLADLSGAAGWATVEIKDDMSITYRGTLYMLISGAAQFKTKVILQLAAAITDKSGLVLIDTADILASGKNRNGLFKLVMASRIPAVICMAFPDSGKVPKGKGIVSYWIEKGIAKEI